MYPKNTAAEIPPCGCFYSVRVKAPSKPYSCTPFIAPFARFAPNPVIGTVAPAPANSII